MDYSRHKKQQEEVEEQEEQSILNHLPLSPQEKKQLQENGFDDLEALKFLDLNTLVALGVSRPQEVMEAIKQILLQFETPDQDEQQEDGREYEYDSQQHLGGDMEEEAYENDDAAMGQTCEASPAKNIINIVDVKPPKEITQALIVQTLQQQSAKLSTSAAANINKTLKGMQLQQTLQKMTHLQLNGKRIQRIGEEIEKSCKSLKVLYLQDNMINQISGLNSLKSLIQLSLYNNQVTKMEGFDGLVSLRRLYLEKNMISKLEGLTNCRSLEELYLSQQETQTDFTFDDYSLAALAGSLKFLDISESRVVEAQPLYYLEKIETLILKRNRIQDFDMHVCPLLQTMNNLVSLDLSDNPVNHIPKYRDQIIIVSGSRLQEIDNKKVTQQERAYLMQLVQRKQRHIGGPKEETKASGKQSGFEVQGKNKILHQTTDIANVMTGTTGSIGSRGSEDETQNQFYSPLDDQKQVLKPRTNIANQSFHNQALMKKRSVNLNANNDFTGAGLTHIQTKHIPMAPIKKA